MIPHPRDPLTDLPSPAMGFRPLRRWTWFAHFAVIHWPLSVERRGVGRIYWALLPYAGEWAYHPDGGGH